MPPDVNTQSINPIDAVILWVDGNDPVLAEKMRKTLEKENIGTNHPGVACTRFASNNEIRYCVFSILKFAPFIRNIFIVTDGQDPGLYKETELNYPGKSGKLKIVDHKEIFRDYEQYLPSFNSSAIHSLIWRINGLSDNFIYFNDDVILVREHKPEDFFINDRPVLRGKWLLPPYLKVGKNKFRKFISGIQSGKAGYQPKISFYIRQWMTASILGFRGKYFFHCHTPHPLSRARLEEFFRENPDLLVKTISHRFRSHDQVLSTSLAYHLEILADNQNREKIRLGYFHPWYSESRLLRRIRRCEKDPLIKTICVQSLDLISDDLRSTLLSWMDEKTKPEPVLQVNNIANDDVINNMQLSS